MEQRPNIPAHAAIGDPPLDPSCTTTHSARLPATLLAKALHSGRDRRRGRAQRADGWTPPRIRAFLEVLARSGSVAAAARAAGMSRQSAYALRASAKGQAFDDAWRRALLLATPGIPDEIMDRAVNGCVEPVIRNGKLSGERHRFDNRLSLRILRRLDRLAASQSPAARMLRAVAEEFDAFVAIVCTGDEEQADAFLRSRCAAHRRGAAQSPNLSTLPGAEPAQSGAPPIGSDSPSEARAPRGESSNVSTLPADRSGVSRRGLPCLSLDSLEKAA